MFQYMNLTDIQQSCQMQADKGLDAALALLFRASRENPTLAEKKKSSIWQL